MGTNFMKKYYSFPILDLIQREASNLNIINSKIYMLSEQTLEKIFKYFSYHEIVKFRCVCIWFYSVAGSILNKKFLSLPDLIDKNITQVLKTSMKNVKVYGYLKVLCIIKSELKILQACCEDYIINNIFYFYGGTIIDIIESILNTSDTKEASEFLIKLLMQVDKFLDNFDKSIEPFLLKKSVCLPQSWFGKKIIDIFECSLNSDKNIELCPNTGSRQGHCRLKGSYESRKIYSIKPPPPFHSNCKMTSTEMFTLMKYFRNHIRWNNTLHYQLQDDIENMSEEDHMTGSPNLIFRRKLNCNKIPFGPTRLIIDFDLYCLKIFAPMKYRVHLQDINKSFDSKESILFDENDYKLHLKLEIGYIENETNQTVAKMKYIKLKQKSCMYIVASETKKMVIKDEKLKDKNI